MRKYIAFVALVLLVVSCKSRKAVFSSEADASVTTREVVRNYDLQSALAFETLHIRGNTNVSFFSINLDIRIKKDEMILITARAPLVGNVAKALITPDYVSYYYRPDSEYFEGDYEFLSHWLGMELDFQKIQNLLLGRALEDLRRERLDITIEDNLYKLSSSRYGLDKAYFFEPDNFRLAKQWVIQKHEERSASVEYSRYKNQDNNSLPSVILINTLSGKHKTLSGKHKNEFQIEYRSFDFNTTVSFPYQIPQGYNRIEID